MANILKVSIKWGKEKYDDLEVNTDESPSVFKMQLYSLTRVPPERQKIMIKGGLLKDDGDWKALGVKNGQTLMMMGTAETEALPTAPEKKTVFVEDLGDKMEVADVTHSPLRPLFNVCFRQIILLD